MFVFVCLSDLKISNINLTIFFICVSSRSAVSSGPLQSIYRKPAECCGQQGGCLCPAGAEDTGTVAAGYLCGQHF